MAYNASMSLKITVRAVQPIKETADVIAIGVFSNFASKAKTSKTPKSPLDGFDRALGGALLKQMRKENFKGKKDQVLSIATLGKVNASRVVVFGLGDETTLSDADVRMFAAKAAKAALAEKGKRLVIGLPHGLASRLRYVAEGVELGAYRFTKYFTGDRAPKATLNSVTITTLETLLPVAKSDIENGQAVAAGVNLARDLSNEPPNVIFPATLAAAAVAMGKEKGLKVQVFDFKQVVAKGMKLLQAVGQGSENKPHLVHLSYIPPRVVGKKNPKRLVFVGKGVTFDSGGLSIKPAAGMGEMKHDMSGAANVIGLMSAVGALKPNIEVHAVLAAAENMPDGSAYRPGDIWGSLDGKTVEIVNTDAEGRLILADALAYARELKPDLMVDNATLTGACVVALGNTCSGFYASNEETASEFGSALKESGEQMWRMPILEELRDQLKSDCADLKHTGDRWGGSITAAIFLREFIGETKNWIHADIAGPAMADRASGWSPKGATGHGVLTFLSLVERAEKAAKTV